MMRKSWLKDSETGGETSVPGDYMVVKWWFNGGKWLFRM